MFKHKNSQEVYKSKPPIGWIYIKYKSCFHCYFPGTESMTDRVEQRDASASNNYNKMLKN